MGRPARPRSTAKRIRKRRPRPENVIFGKERQRTSGRKPVQGSWSSTLLVDRELAFDFDVRPLVEWLSVNLAALYSEQLERGQGPDGERIPNVTSWTKIVSGNNRKRDTLMMRTGFGAERWWLGAIRGNAASAMRTIKPYGGSDGPKPPKPAGRDVLWEVMLKRGFDPQSVKGRAKRIAAETMADWLKTTVGENPGIDVKTVGEALLKDVEDE
ncbi:MAG: hypothetical protein KC501_25005 [Myxococcales bacterium]|nr:hypothetical protein [Myxococcales bacterium]